MSTAGDTALDAQMASLTINSAEVPKVSKRHHRTLPPFTFRGPQTLVTFEIGTGDFKESFFLLKSVITSSSPFFEAAFNNSNFAEGRDQSMDLDDVEPDVFELVVNWLYTQDITLASATNPTLPQLAQCWTLADRFLIPDLQNHAMTRIWSRVESRKPDIPFQEWQSFLKYVYRDEVVGDNPLMKLGLNEVLRALQRQLERVERAGNLNNDAEKEKVFSPIQRITPSRMWPEVSKCLFKLIGKDDWHEHKSLGPLASYLVDTDTAV